MSACVTCGGDGLLMTLSPEGAECATCQAAPPVDPAALVAELDAERAAAVAARDLGAVLAAEDRYERVMSDEPRGGRLSCYGCRDWADHAHDVLTGARITLDAYHRRGAGWAAHPGGWLP